MLCDELIFKNINQSINFWFSRLIWSSMCRFPWIRRNSHSTHYEDYYAKNHFVVMMSRFFYYIYISPLQKYAKIKTALDFSISINSISRYRCVINHCDIAKVGIIVRIHVFINTWTQANLWRWSVPAKWNIMTGALTVFVS